MPPAHLSFRSRNSTAAHGTRYSAAAIPLKSRWEWVRAVLLWKKRYSSVLLRGLQKRSEMDLENIYFMCIDAKDMAEIFAPGEVDRIYLNFSDPWPKDRHAKRRLTSPVFMSVYDKILAPQGVVEFKTDNRGLFEYSLESIPDAGWEITEYTFDLHNSPMAEGNVMTEYEMKFASEGKPICKLIARRTGTFGQDPA